MRKYIKQVEKELHLSRKVKKEVVRDLEEIFSSAMEHGETERQVIERLGTPKEFADSTAEQFGVDNAAARNRKEIISCVMGLLISAVCFLIYAAAQIEKVPEGTIGQADAMTNIRIESAFPFHPAQIILIVGIMAAVFAAIQMIRTVRKNRRQL